jgi:hypothetical protein
MNTPNRDLREIVREEPVMRGRILAALANGPLTIPEIAAELEVPSHEVVLWVMGMRRYGHVAEVKGANDSGYFSYEAIIKTPAPARAARDESGNRA